MQHVRVRSFVVVSDNATALVLHKRGEGRVVGAVECNVFVEVLYGYGVDSLVGESELEQVRGFSKVGNDEDDQLVGEIEDYGHLGTQRSFNQAHGYL